MRTSFTTKPARSEKAREHVAWPIEEAHRIKREEMRAVVETARLLGRRIEAHAHGGVAKLVAIRGDPLADPSLLEHPNLVMKGGSVVVHEAHAVARSAPAIR